MGTTETRRLSDLAALVAEVRADLLGDEASGYAEYCELKGTLTSSEPVRGELSGEDVAIYESRVERLLETRHETRHDDGRITSEWRKSTESLSSNRREATFFLDDGTGRVRVDIAGAELSLEKVVDRFEPPGAVEREGDGALALTIGGFSLSVAGVDTRSDRRTVGYRFEERILPLGRDVYALGEVIDTGDGLILRKTAEKEQPFVLSLRSETQLIGASEASARWRKAVGAVAIAVGIALAVIGLLK